MTPFFSIIIPAYNVENYIDQSISSILNQSFQDFEIIIINDGSADKTSNIINEGLPKARKTGLDNAVAEFVIHCDSDDWLEPNALYLLYEKQKSTNASIVRTNMIYHFKNNIYQSKFIIDYDYSIDPLVWFLLNGENTLCGTLYKKDLFADYIVPDNFAGEDGVTNIQIFSKIKPCELCYLESSVYNYDCKYSDPYKVYNTYSTIWEEPHYKSKLYMKELLKKYGKDTNEVLSAFSFYMILSYVIPYLKRRKKILKKETSHFYNEYWKNCEYKYLLGKSDRVIIPLFYFSILLGNIHKNKFIFSVITKTD